jgi:hypothetical protein
LTIQEEGADGKGMPSQLVVAATSGTDGTSASAADPTTHALDAAVTRARYASTMMQLAAEVVRAADGGSDSPVTSADAHSKEAASVANITELEGKATSVTGDDASDAHAEPRTRRAARFDLAGMWHRRRQRPRPSQAKVQQADSSEVTLALLALVLDCYTDLARYPRCAPHFLDLFEAASMLLSHRDNCAIEAQNS